MPAAWATADEFYGGDRRLRRDLQDRGIRYVLAVARSHRVTAFAAIGPQRADQVAADLSARAWNRYSAGDGSKGRREYDWAWLSITPPDDEASGHHAVLVRRRLSDGELAFYRCWAPTPVGLPTLVRDSIPAWSANATAARSTRSCSGALGPGRPPAEPTRPPFPSRSR
ncbi:MAG TPA: hypothetical protein VFR67_24090 [Pilimelia sp.]|nr:hypothetical protein [Pilimelia sp.]